MKNAKTILISNLIILGVIILIQLLSPSLGTYLLDSKIEFSNEDSAYWIVKLIEINTVQRFCLLVGLLNVSLIAVSTNYLLKHN